MVICFVFRPSQPNQSPQNVDIQNDAVVSIRYTLKDLEGNVLDTNVEGDPLNYLQGHGNIVIGLEEALQGKQSGDNIDVQIPAEKAYGERQPNLEAKIPRDRFPEGADLQVNMHFEAENEHGRHPFMITEVHDDHVVADGNHPLAGKPLHFQVEVLEVREATSDEIAHGHVHGPGGHHH